MIQAPKSSYPKLFFRDPFNNEQLTRKLGGIPTDVTYENGKIVCNGTSSKINYNLPLNGTYSVRIRCNPTSFPAAMNLIDCVSSNADGTGYVYLIGTTGLVEYSNGTPYVNGVATTTTVVGVNNEIVVTGITLRQGSGANKILIGSNHLDAYEFLGGIDLVEIYEGTLTASEVANLYNDSWNRELTNKDTLLDYDSTNGVHQDHSGLNTLTATNVDIVKAGRSYSGLYNSTTSNLDTGSDFIGTKAVTVMGWIKPYSFGENSQGRILGNGNIIFSTYGSSEFLIFSSNGAITGVSANNSIVLNKKQFVAVTRTTLGVVNLYIGDKDTAPALNGSTDQSSGTPAAGTTNVIIGNTSTGSRTFDGLIPKLKVVEGILTLAQITQYWSETLKEI